MAYIAAILARAGHEVKWTRGELVDGDVALVLSSLVDHKNETAWADRMRARGVKVGLHRHHGVEDAGAVRRSLRLHPQRRARSGASCAWRRAIDAVRASSISEQIDDLDSLPFPRWDLVTEDRAGSWASSGRRGRSAAAIRCSRAAAARSSAPTARTGFSPATARGRSRTSSTRSSGCATSVPRPYVIFRDPLFTEQRDRCLELCDEIERARPDAHVRSGDAARSARRRAARPAATRPASAR